MSNEQQFYLDGPQNEPQKEKLDVQSNEQQTEQPLLLIEQPDRQSIILNEQQLIPEDGIGIASMPLKSLLSEETSRETDSSSCVEELRLAMRDKDADWCRRLAVQAGSRHDRQAVPALQELLRKPNGGLPGMLGNQRKGRNSAQWLAARCAAAIALGQIGDRSALPDLCSALLDRSSLVQQAASEAVLVFGADAGPILIKKLERPGNWSLSGMKILIATLGRLEQPESAVALSRVILGELPALPLRWKYLPMEWGLIPLFCYFLMLACMFFSSFMSGIAIVLIALLALAYMTLVLPFRNRRKNREMQSLAAIAGDALYAVQNKNVLPVVIAAAFGPHPRTRQQIARKALESLLPLLNEEDTDFFPVTARTYLILAVGSSGESLDLPLLRAMEFVGNGQALPAVARLARYGATEEIQREAARILPILHARMEQAKVSSMLLRASDQPRTQADQLLRASFESAEIPAGELLRSAEVEQEEG